MPTFGRRQTLIDTMKMLNMVHPGPVSIIETGTLRDDNERGCEGDGWSSVAWAWYCAQTGGRLYTIDIDENALSACRRATTEYAPSVDYIHGDSITFLSKWDVAKAGPIHLAYLDSFDYHINADQSSACNLAEAKAILPSLASHGLVLIDDTWTTGAGYEGKGTKTVFYLLNRGFHLEWCEGRQVLLSRES